MFGESSYKKCVEILETGTCEKLESLKENNKIKVILELTKLHGLGIKTAAKLAENGIASLKMLNSTLSEGKSDLLKGVKISETLRFSLQKHEQGLLEKWNKKEVDEFVATILEPSLKSAEILEFEKSSEIKLKHQVVGGFRRGKETGHDLDVLISIESAKTPPFSDKIVPYEDFSKALSEQSSHFDSLISTILEQIRLKNGIEIKDLSIGNAFHGSGNISSKTCLLFVFFRGKWRRLDLVFVPSLSWPFALLGWSGSKMFERSIRFYTTSFKNEFIEGNPGVKYSLASSGLYIVVSTTEKKLQAVILSSEQEIFSFLGLDYLEPSQRCH